VFARQPGIFDTPIVFTGSEVSNAAVGDLNRDGVDDVFLLGFGTDPSTLLISQP
jgi:hypothetical protein